MIVETTRFGFLEYKEEQVISFTAGLPGFKQYSKFMIVTVDDSPFQYLQSLEEGELAFIIVSPFDFIPDYEFELSEQVKEELKIEKREDVQVFTIVRVPEDLASATINLLAPVVINISGQCGVQYILPSSEYSVQYPLFLNDLSTGGK